MTKLLAFQVFVAALLSALAVGFASLIYVSYQDYTDPKHVYGRWVEIGAPPFQIEYLELNEQGFFRNNRLVSTNFEFDGERVYVTTGSGASVYQVAGTYDSPQLKRLVPNSPTQRFIKEGYESTVDMQGGGAAKKRRAALSDHFSQ